MIDTVNRTFYKAFGFILSSEIPLPELPKVNEQVVADIEIRLGDLSKLWSELVAPHKKIVVKENLVIFEASDTAKFCIQDGKRIIVSPLKGCDEDEMRLFILGTCMGALLMQRKILTLHGSAVVIDGKAYGFIGNSGAGKSTLALAFLNNGYQLLSDDLIAIIPSHDKTPLVMPAYPQQKLWQETLQEFRMETSLYRPLFQRETKYAIPVSSKFSAEPARLAGLFEIVTTESGKLEIYSIDKLQRLQTLLLHTYRNFFIARSGLTEWHFHTSVSIVNQMEFYQVRRPTTGFSAPHLVPLILTTLRKEAS